MGNSKSFNRRDYFIKALEKKKNNISPDNLLPYIFQPEDKRLGKCLAYVYYKNNEYKILIEYWEFIDSLRTTREDKFNHKLYSWSCCNCKNEIHPPNRCNLERKGKYKLLD
jgi:hypothetical protein